MSCMVTKPQGFCSQPENATFTLRPKSWVSGWPIKNFEQALAYGVVSNVSSWQIPASGQAVTLRTTLPQASRRRDPDGSEPAHERGRIVDVHVVKLDILARRHMDHTVGVFLGKIGQGFQLFRRYAAERES